MRLKVLPALLTLQVAGQAGWRELADRKSAGSGEGNLPEQRGGRGLVQVDKGRCGTTLLASCKENQVLWPQQRQRLELSAVELTAERIDPEHTADLQIAAILTIVSALTAAPSCALRSCTPCALASSS